MLDHRTRAYGTEAANPLRAAAALAFLVGVVLEGVG
jgi:hypothetical protein